MELIFADDIAALVVADDLQMSSDLAGFTAVTMDEVLRLRHLSMQRGETQNLLYDPRITPKGGFQRTDRTVAPSTKKRMQGQLQREARRSHLIQEVVLDFDPNETVEMDSKIKTNEYPSPFPLMDEIKILGVIFDRHFTFDGHFAHTLTKARVGRAFWRE